MELFVEYLLSLVVHEYGDLIRGMNEAEPMSCGCQAWIKRLGSHQPPPTDSELRVCDHPSLHYLFN